MTTLFLSASDMKLTDALLYALVGFLIVLAALAILVGIFYLTGFIFKTEAMSRDKLFKRKKREHKNADVRADDPESDDGELAAAITAAIACMYEQESSDVKPDFVIRRIVRKK